MTFSKQLFLSKEFSVFSRCCKLLNEKGQKDLKVPSTDIRTQFGIGGQLLLVTCFEISKINTLFSLFIPLVGLVIP